MLVLIDSTEPVAELPKIPHHVHPSRAMFPIRCPEPPLHIIQRRDRKKWHSPIPIRWYQPHTEAHKRPCNAEMSQDSSISILIPEMQISTSGFLIRCSRFLIRKCRFLIRKSRLLIGVPVS